MPRPKTAIRLAHRKVHIAPIVHHRVFRGSGREVPDIVDPGGERAEGGGEDEGEEEGAEGVALDADAGEREGEAGEGVGEGG